MKPENNCKECLDWANYAGELAIYYASLEKEFKDKCQCKHAVDEDTGEPR